MKLFISIILLATATLNAADWRILPGFPTQEAALVRSHRALTNQLSSHALQQLAAGELVTRYKYGRRVDPGRTNTWALMLEPVVAGREPTEETRLPEQDRTNVVTRTFEDFDEGPIVREMIEQGER